jgi:hypothetical protein
MSHLPESFTNVTDSSRSPSLSLRLAPSTSESISASLISRDEEWGFFVELDPSFNKNKIQFQTQKNQIYSKKMCSYLNVIYEEDKWYKRDEDEDEYEDEYDRDKKPNPNPTPKKITEEIMEEPINKQSTTSLIIYGIICATLISISFIII